MPIERGKTICFIDNSNIFQGMKKFRIDWKKFQQYLDRNGSIWQTYFFASTQDPPRDIQNNFYQLLQRELRW